jgi:A/G-specific adenine glycosylase
MELGAAICTPRNPSCVSCPLASECVAQRSGRVLELPRPKEQKATRALTIPLFIIRDDRNRVLVLRASGALMDSMFHLPHGNTDLLPSVRLDAKRGRLLGTFPHTITTRRITFEVCEATIDGHIRDGAEARWIDAADLASLPHPSYVKKAMRLAAEASAQRTLMD